MAHGQDIHLVLAERNFAHVLLLEHELAQQVIVLVIQKTVALQKLKHSLVLQQLHGIAQLHMAINTLLALMYLILELVNKQFLVLQVAILLVLRANG